jgi:hypothetical protein
MTTYCDIHTHVLEPSKDTDTLLSEACCKAVDFLHNNWQLARPNCHVYVTPRWQTIFLDEPPKLWRTLYKIGFSILPKRRKMLESLWPRSAGWFERYGKLCFIAIKPLRDFQTMNLGNSPLYEAMSAREKFYNTLVHELTHAFTVHLKLPLWLNEGFALVAAEQMLGYGRVRRETLELLQTPRKKIGYLHLPNLAGEDFYYHYAKGYWLTRYLQEQEGGLGGFLKKPLSYQKINNHLRKLFNNQTSDSVLYQYFKAKAS